MPAAGLAEDVDLPNKKKQKKIWTISGIVYFIYNVKSSILYRGTEKMWI